MKVLEYDKIIYDEWAVGKKGESNFAAIGVEGNESF